MKGSAKRPPTISTRRSRCCLRKIHGDDDVDDEELQRVVVEAGLELRGDQAPEAALPVARRLGGTQLRADAGSFGRAAESGLEVAVAIGLESSSILAQACVRRAKARLGRF